MYRTLQHFIEDAVDPWGNDLDAEQLLDDVRFQIEKMITYRKQEIDAHRKSVNWTSDEDLPPSSRNYVWDTIQNIRGIELVADAFGIELFEDQDPNV